MLAFVKEQSVLLTGLLNAQVVRTADMMDMHCIVFVRGKNPDAQIVGLAADRGIVLMRTEERMYTACGKLYAAGLNGLGCEHAWIGYIFILKLMEVILPLRGRPPER